jgi:type IV pilus assembly protein PilP
MSRRISILGIALLAVAAAGCSRDMKDLDAYMAEVKARPGGKIEPLPEIKVYQGYDYEPSGARSPFVAQEPTAQGGAVGGVRPDADRRREYLEGFPLDTLDMVGTLRMGGRLYGLVQTNDGLVHRVLPGNYLGQNDGRITAIAETEVQLIEIIPDGLGSYTERAASIGLGEN